jgi:hypothetical protein
MPEAFAEERAYRKACPTEENVSKSIVVSPRLPQYKASTSGAMLMWRVALRDNA